MQAHGSTPILTASSLGESFAWFGKLGWAKRWDWGDHDHPHRHGHGHDHDHR